MRKIIYIICFAFIGGALREALTLWSGDYHALMVILINLSGSFLLAYLTGILPEIVWVSDNVLTGISVGLIGSYTTFSTFAVDTIKLSAQPILGLIYLLLSLVGGYAMVILGRRLSLWQLARWGSK